MLSHSADLRPNFRGANTNPNEPPVANHCSASRNHDGPNSDTNDTQRGRARCYPGANDRANTSGFKT